MRLNRRVIIFRVILAVGVYCGSISGFRAAELPLSHLLKQQGFEKMRLGELEKLTSSAQNLQALKVLSAAYEQTAYAATNMAEEAVIRTRQVQDYQLLLVKNPEWMELLYQLATQQIALQRLKPERLDVLAEAVKNLNFLIQVATKNKQKDQLIQGYFQLGRALKHQGDTASSLGNPQLMQTKYQHSLLAFTHTLNLDAQRIDAVGEVVLIYRALGDLQSAISVVRNNLPHLKQQHLAAKSYEMLGVLLQEANLNADARTAFNQSITLNKGMMGAYLHLAQLNQLDGNNQHAALILRQSIEVNPVFIESYLNLGAILVGLRQNTEARVIFEQALSIKQEEAISLGMFPSKQLYISHTFYKIAAYLAWLYLQDNQLEKALAVALKAQQFQALDAHLADTLGEIYSRLGNVIEASAAFNQAIEMKNLPSAHFHLAELLVKQGDIKQAKRHLVAALAAPQDFHYRAQAIDLQNSLKKR
ncbi:MAG: hypothetical protein GQ582_13570 [Methyloprofundus sp.]|nr:hypothetical protein [Methyloprofundus sp.]